MPSVVPDWGYPLYYIGLAAIGLGVLIYAVLKK